MVAGASEGLGLVKIGGDVGEFGGVAVELFEVDFHHHKSFYPLKRITFNL